MERGQTPLFMYELLEKLVHGATVLDLGCGNGSLCCADFPALTIYSLFANFMLSWIISGPYFVVWLNWITIYGHTLAASK